MRFHERFEHPTRNAIVEVGGLGRRACRVRRRGRRCRQAHGISSGPPARRRPASGHHLAWDIFGTRLVRMPRNTLVSVCDDVVVAYTTRQEAGLGHPPAPRGTATWWRDPLDTEA